MILKAQYIWGTPAKCGSKFLIFPSNFAYKHNFTYFVKKKGKSVPMDAMKARGRKVKLHIFLNSAIDGGKGFM